MRRDICVNGTATFLNLIINANTETATANRIAAEKNGGTVCKPILIANQVVPQRRQMSMYARIMLSGEVFKE